MNTIDSIFYKFNKRVWVFNRIKNTVKGLQEYFVDKARKPVSGICIF